LAETYRRKGDTNLAIDFFRRSSQAAPNNPEPLLQLGILMDGNGRADQAQPIYERILTLQPDHPIALNNLAYIKAEQGVDLESAMTMAQRARQKDPNNTNIEDTLGWIYIKKNLTEDAIRIFKDLTVKEPENPSFHYHYGMAFFQKGDRASAKKELSAALATKIPPTKQEKDQIQQLLQKL
jgi:Flp pilus assembly protein TadD